MIMYQLTDDCSALPEKFTWSLTIHDFQQYPALYLMIVGFTVAFFLNFAVGANDAANSWATSVGAGTVSLGWAYFLGGLFESLGVTLCSANVISRLIEGIIDINMFKSLKNETLQDWNSEKTELLEKEKILMIGALSALLSSALWQLSAIWFKMPVSGSQSIVSGLVGFSLVSHGGVGVKWDQVRYIMWGWVLTPVVSMILTMAIYIPTYLAVVQSKNLFSFKSKVAFSLILGLTVTFLLVTLLTTGEIFCERVGWSSQWVGGRGVFFLISGMFGAIAACMGYCCLIPLILVSEGDFSLTCPCLEEEEEEDNKNEVWTTNTPVVRMVESVGDETNEKRDREILKIKKYKKERSLLLNKELSPMRTKREEQNNYMSKNTDFFENEVFRIPPDMMIKNTEVLYVLFV